MKSLLDIQKEIKDMEQAGRKLTENLAEISREVQALREADDDKETDFVQIKALAANMPFTGHPLKQLKDTYASKIYIELLLCVLRLDNHDATEKLTFVQWILQKSYLKIELQDAYTESLTLEKEIFSEAAGLWEKDYRLYFLVDAFLVSHFTGPVNAETVEYIAHLSIVLGLNEDEVSVCADIAKIILFQDARWVKKSRAAELLPWLDKFEHYLDAAYKESMITKCREFCVEYGEDDSFKWKVKQKEYVKKGQVIATYVFCENKIGYAWRYGRGQGTIKEMKATSSGYLYQFTLNGIKYGVISVEEDDKDSIKAWVKEGQKSS